MKKIAKFLTTVLCACMVGGTLTACGDNTPEGFTGIKFLYEADMYTNDTFYELVREYNNTQGKEDKVYVTPSMIAGVGNERSTYEGTCDSNVVMIGEKTFKDIAIDGLFVDLTDYATADAVDFSNVPEAFENSARMTVGQNGAKTVVGKDQKLVAMPFGSSPYVIFYNTAYFNAMGIKIISATEEELKTNASYSKLQPHGYAEYTAESGAQAPIEGVVASKNLAGENVYKIFNNKIPMNWEELRYVSKMFTKEYNNSALQSANIKSEYGYANEWWFSFGWSVGADCIGWDGEKYDFTLMDKSANWLATTDVTVNNKTYSAGEIVSYEDKIKEGETAMADKEGLCKLPSGYEAQIQFLSYNVPTRNAIDTNTPGWGIAPENQERVSLFTSGTVAMVCETFLTSIRQFQDSTNVRSNFDIAPQQQYRRYKGGSVYYKGSETFANEYLKVIGKKYDNAVYTGELYEENNTPIVGSQDVSSGYLYLVIPRNSESEKYDASWSFIKWAASRSGQKIIAKAKNITPADQEVAFDDFCKQAPTLNYWAVADAHTHSGLSDWAYFENGEWVNKWSGFYNDYLRHGTKTITDFMTYAEADAARACANTTIVYRGKK